MLYPPVTIRHLEAVETRLELVFPAALKELLLESNGVMDTLSVDGSEFFENLWLIWPVEMIQEENLKFRNSDPNAPGLLFFASAGTDGILFGLPVSPNESPDGPVIAWYPLGERIVPLANSLSEFIEGWLTNQISV